MEHDQHKKGAVDAKRGKLFTKLIKEVTTAARLGGGDPGGNPRLRQAVDAARAANMPGDNLERAIKKGTGELEGVIYDEVAYEGYGPEGVAVLVETMTDNRNRTVADIRHLFSKYNGNLGENGCVAWMFDSIGLIVMEKSVTSEEQLMDVALEAGADDIKEEGDTFEVTTSFEDFDTVKKAIEAAGIPVVSAEQTRLPQTTVKLDGKSAQTMLKLYSLLDDHEDVQNVYANFDIPDEIMENFSGMIAVGIDPGTIKTGYGIVRKDGGRFVRLGSGVIRTNAKQPFEQRLLTIFQELETVLTTFAPDEAAVEDLFFAKNANSALKLGHARGVILLALARREIPVASYPPTLVKRSIVGAGRAAKEQVQRVVRAILRLDFEPAEDEADALALAVTHLNAAGFKKAQEIRSAK